MMNNRELKKEIDRLAYELFPDITFDFDFNRIQLNVCTGHVSVRSSVSIDRFEIAYNGILNESKLKNILKIRVRNALLELKDFVQNKLERLDE